ncbi:MAG: D-TA family PLP-dependent enzyme [Bacteroidota bacterium]
MSQQGKSSDNWFLIDNEEDVFSPSLLVYHDRIEENIRRMIAVAGGTERLRPHVKTHKMPGIIRLQLKHGISKFKCATIAEAEMTAGAGAPDVLMAYQPAGPNIRRFFDLISAFPKTRLSCIADSEEIIMRLSDAATTRKKQISVWLDINVGMNRTGIVPGENALKLAMLITRLPMLDFGGLHVYDGHIHEPDPVLRAELCDEAYAPVIDFTGDLARAGINAPGIVAGGSPTFPVHALRKGVELSPGTLLLWDHGYGSEFTDMDFLQAAVLFTRVVSKPADDLICLDLGHKAVASEMPQPRIHIPGFGKFSIISHNEEHMVIRTVKASEMKIGSVVYAIPFHICPTVDRHDTVSVVRNGIVTEQWQVQARRRKITI